MAHYPINLDLRGRKCIVVGGGDVAERKVENLLDFGASVTVISPSITERLQALGSFKHVPRAYETGDLMGAWLAIAATDDRAVNEAVSREAQALGIPVNVVDDPELCTFLVPSVVKRGDFVVAISTSGKSPTLAKRVREKLEQEFGPEYSELADLMGDLRDEVKAKYPDMKGRARAYERILDSDVLRLLAEGKRDEAMEAARKCI